MFRWLRKKTSLFTTQQVPVDAILEAMDGDLAIVLTGGGARAAYQVGVLRALARRLPNARFPIITGVSAGAINASFLAGDLVDELALTLCPVILGGAAAPTPVEGEGFDRDSLRRARLDSVEQKGGELFLRYSFHRSG